MKLKNIFFVAVILTSQICFSQIKIDSSKIVRVLTFNIFHGATTKGDFNLDLIAKVIKDANPDLVALQEVDFKTKRAKNYDLATEFGWRTKMASLFAKAMNFDGGEYGDAILSKYSFINSFKQPLPYTKKHEPRVALAVTTILPSGDTIVFISTHLDHLKDDTIRLTQAKKIKEIFSSNKYPTILAGDFNDIPTSKTLNLLEENWTASYKKGNIVPTYPSDHPTEKIDYVMFYPKNRWRVLSTKVIQNTIASDHCAYLVTLALLDKK